MSFIPDCSRSARRLSHGKTLVAVLKDLDIMSGRTIKDGFSVSAIQFDGIEKITITAPAGLVVLRSHETGISVYHSEFWKSALSGDREMQSIAAYPDNYTSYWGAYSFKIYSGDLEENEFGYTGVEIEKASPCREPGNFIGGEPDNPDPCIHADRSMCVPAVVPYYGSELLIYSLSYMRGFDTVPYVIAGSDDSDPYAWRLNQLRLELFMDSYGGTCSSLNPSGTVWAVDHRHVAVNWTTQTCLNNTFVQYYGSEVLSYDPGTATTYLARIINMRSPKDIVEKGVGPSDAWTDLPPELYYALSQLSNINEYNLYVNIFGSYAYTHPFTGLTTLLTVVWVKPLGYPIWDFFRDENGQSSETCKWRLFYSIYTEGREATDTEPAISPSSVIVNGRDGIFSTLLDIHDVPDQTYFHDTNDEFWDFIKDAMEQFLPYPNVNTYSPTPHDSIMFHTPGGIYTWTRNNGCVFFGPYGFEQASINVPQEVVSEPGVRPFITYGGTDSYGNHTYLCVCDRVTVDIPAVYFGSPFGSWTSLPMPEGTLLYVQPVQVTYNGVILLGVVRVLGKYRAAFLRYSTENGGDWKLMAEIQVEDEEPNAWCMSLYGNEPIVELQRTYPSQPAATVQPYFLPYEEYPGVTLTRAYNI